MRSIERRVDFLGIPVRKTSPKSGHEEFLDGPRIIKTYLRYFSLLDESKPFGKMVAVTVLPDGAIKLETGHYQLYTVYGGGEVDSVTVESKTIRSGKIVGPRRKSGKRISFIFKEDSPRDSTAEVNRVRNT